MNTPPLKHGSVRDLVARLVRGEPRALARALTLIDIGGAAAHEVEAALDAHRGHARVVGVTGPPGAGKSTLVDRFVAELRARGRSVAAILVDPSSPVSGGALLGDRVRMGGHSADTKVFIRSVSSRGSVGGLGRSVASIVRAMSAAGWDDIVIETVGAGQSEVEVARIADVTLVVWVPGLGDEVQAMKAGILEIADIVVINKGDTPGAENTARQIESVLSLRSVGLLPPVLRTVATAGSGIAELVDAVERAAGAKRAERPPEVRARVAAAIAREVESRILSGQLDEALRSILAAVERGDLRAHDAAAALCSRLAAVT